MNHHRTLRLMERVCDHMLEAYIPQLTKKRVVLDKKGKEIEQISDDMVLFETIMQVAEEGFYDASDTTGAEDIPDDYYANVKTILDDLQEKAKALSPCEATSSVLRFSAVYNQPKKTYEISDIKMRPCVWETGLIRQLTDRAVKGLASSATKGISLTFRVKMGAAYLITLTMEDEPDIFKDTTPITNVTEKVYTIPPENFVYWNEFYDGIPGVQYGLDDKLKQGWSVEDLKMNKNRFSDAKKKFRSMSAAVKYALQAYVKSSLKSKVKARGKQ